MALLPSLRGGEPFSALHREIDRVFSEFARSMPKLGEPWLGEAWEGALKPSMDVKETDKAVEVTVELPGLSEKDVEVSVSDRVLTISGEKKTEEERKGENYHVMERCYGRFSRSVTLPFEPDSNKVEASFAKGVLTITLPKPPEVAAKSKKIAVKAKG
jgi:HSP20 family protein